MTGEAGLDARGVEDVPCNVCGGIATRRLFQAQGFWIVRCSRCGLVYVNPRLDAAGRRRVYADEYFLKLPNADVLAGPPGWTLDPVSWEAQRARLATAGTTHGRLLDVGCATGYFLWTVQRLGWEVWGVEPNATAAAYAARHLGATVLCGEVEQQDLPHQYFDTVSLWHVIEHLPDPRSTLRAIRRLLRHKGRLILECPDFASLGARKRGASWAHVKPEEHLYYFDERSLRSLLAAEGLVIDRIRRVGGLGMLSAAASSGAPATRLRQWLFELRRLIAPRPGLRAIARYVFWDLLGQNDHLLVVASAGA